MSEKSRRPIPADVSAHSVLIRRLLDLRHQLQRQTTDASSLSVSLMAACRASTQVLEEDIRRRNHRVSALGEDGNTSFSACNIIERSIPSFLDGLCKAQPARGGTRAGYPGLADMVLLFGRVLDQMHHFILQEALLASSTSQAAVKTRSQLRIRQCGLLSEGSSHICKQLQGVLMQFFQGLDLGRVIHMRLAVGLCCTFLEHVGLLASILAFGETGLSPEDHCPGILPPRGVQMLSEADPRILSEVIPAEISFLQPVLREVETVATQLTTQNQALASASPVADFRLMLQHTLLRAIFDDQDETFHRAYPRAEAADNVSDCLTTSADEPDDIKAKFLSDLWDLAGWDCLSTD